MNATVEQEYRAASAGLNVQADAASNAQDAWPTDDELARFARKFQVAARPAPWSFCEFAAIIASVPVVAIRPPALDDDLSLSLPRAWLDEVARSLSPYGGLYLFLKVDYTSLGYLQLVYEQPLLRLKSIAMARDARQPTVNAAMVLQAEGVASPPDLRLRLPLVLPACPRADWESDAGRPWFRDVLKLAIARETSWRWSTELVTGEEAVAEAAATYQLATGGHE